MTHDDHCFQSQRLLSQKHLPQLRNEQVGAAILSESRQSWPSPRVLAQVAILQQKSGVLAKRQREGRAARGRIFCETIGDQRGWSGAVSVFSRCATGQLANQAFQARQCQLSALQTGRGYPRRTMRLITPLRTMVQMMGPLWGMKTPKTGSKTPRVTTKSDHPTRQLTLKHVLPGSHIGVAGHKHSCITKSTKRIQSSMPTKSQSRVNWQKLSAHLLKMTCAKKCRADGGIMQQSLFWCALFYFPSAARQLMLARWLKRCRSGATRTHAERGRLEKWKSFAKALLMIRTLQRASSTRSSLDLHVVAWSQPT